MIDPDATGVGDDAPYYWLSEDNAGRSCDDCGAEATAYVHHTGFRCGDCADVPDERRPPISERRET